MKSQAEPARRAGGKTRVKKDQGVNASPATRRRKASLKGDEAASPDEDTPTTRAPAVNRAAAILRLLARSDAPLGVNSIARHVGIVPSTCHHIIRALEIEDLISVDPDDRRCSIGLGLVNLARRALNQNLPEANAQFELDSIAEEFKLTTSLTRLDNRQRMVVVAVAEPEVPFAIRVNIGQRLPVWASATGRLYASTLDLPNGKLQKHFNAVKWAVQPTFEEWHSQVEYARTNGIGVDRGFFVPGIEIHAAAVHEYGRMQGTIAALTTIGTQDKNREQELHEALRTAAERLST